MSVQAQRILAGIALTAFLVLAVPAPSHAAGFRTPVRSFDVVDRIWNWLESLWLGEGAAKSSPAVREQEGSMIDPNGGKIIRRPDPSSLLPTGILSDEGSMIDPNG